MHNKMLLAERVGKHAIYFQTQFHSCNNSSITTIKNHNLNTRFVYLASYVFVFNNQCTHPTPKCHER
jgi:hypothetical protein